MLKCLIDTNIILIGALDLDENKDSDEAKIIKLLTEGKIRPIITLQLLNECHMAAKRLVDLDRDVDIGLELEKLKFRPDWNQVRREYEDLGFKSIVAKLPGETSSQPTVHSSQNEIKNKIERKTVNHQSRTDNRKQLKLV